MGRLGKLGYGLLLWIVAGMAWGENTFEQPHIYVQGNGEVSAAPELAHLQLSVSVSASSSTGAKHQADERVSGLLQALSGFKVKHDELKASDLQLSPEYQVVDQGRREQIGFRATRQVRLSLADLSQLSKLLEAVLEQGVTDIQQIQLDVSDRQKYQDKARALAVADARRKATGLAQEFGVHLGKVYRIEYLQRSAPIPLMVRHAAIAEYENSYSQPALTFSDQVTAVFLMQP